MNRQLIWAKGESTQGHAASQYTMSHNTSIVVWSIAGTASVHLFIAQVMYRTQRYGQLAPRMNHDKRPGLAAAAAAVGRFLWTLTHWRIDTYPRRTRWADHVSCCADVPRSLPSTCRRRYQRPTGGESVVSLRRAGGSCNKWRHNITKYFT